MVVSAGDGSPKSRRVLVTGGAGFLGSALINRLLAEGASVTCLDDFSSAGGNNIERHRDNPHFSLIRQDVCAAVDLEVDEIYNLACPASPPRYQSDPIGTLRTAVFGAMNMLELATTLDCPILQASTSEIYGDPQVQPQREDYWGFVNPVGPRSCYDEGKRAAETLCMDFRRQRGTKIKIARIFNTYGPGMQADDGRVVSNFIVQALRNEPITLYGDGRQTRSFCYVDDMVDGLMRLMATPAESTGPVNIGNDGEFTMIELAELVLELTNSKSPLVNMPLPGDDPKRRKPDIGLARERLGWTPTTPLRAGLQPTIGYFAALLEGSREIVGS